VTWYLGTAQCKGDKEGQDRLVIQKTLKESCRELQRSRLLCANKLVETNDNFAGGD